MPPICIEPGCGKKRLSGGFYCAEHEVTNIPIRGFLSQVNIETMVGNSLQSVTRNYRDYSRERTLVQVGLYTSRTIDMFKALSLNAFGKWDMPLTGRFLTQSDLVRLLTK